ncbi:hypothetical protein RCL_jg17204.t1 [Rhizophagus clarus]|uniref:Uncharacterized protein n=1 Tax=Rhizophagus clarus TaxID=94130 RepID=A0A8H3MB22_9GLOM|nr:hypothetical protein RCL_jg17204.t1 [Rhizophagus clarus]
MELSAYSLISDYLQNMNKGIIPAKTNIVIEEIVAALGQIKIKLKLYQNKVEILNATYIENLTILLKIAVVKLISAFLKSKNANKPKFSNSINNKNNVIVNSCEQENINLNKEKSVKWKKLLEDFKENEPKGKEMYNLWQISGRKVELEESSIQAVLRET